MLRQWNEQAGVWCGLSIPNMFNEIGRGKIYRGLEMKSIQ
jgi:hypothetical protein